MADRTTPMMTDTEDTAVDMKLFKFIGLYQYLCPIERGGFKKWVHLTSMTVVLTNISYFVVQFGWLPSAMNDIQRTMDTLMVLTYSLALAIKAYALLSNAPRFWTAMDTCRFTFIACVTRRPNAMRRARDTVSQLVRIIFIMTMATAVGWLSIPLFFSKYVTVAHRDGTVGQYRTTVYSVWFPLPQRIHNLTSFWMFMNGFESLSFILNLPGYFMFDCYVLTLCFVLNAQFRTISAGYEALGHRLQTSRSENHQDTLQNVSNKPMQSNDYRDLINLIKDNQKIINKYDEFIDIVKFPIIVQVMVVSFALITYIFFLCMAFLSDQPTVDMKLFKIVSTLILYIIQLYTYCIGFDYIETAKSTLNVGLYSSNWTEMDLKFKKTVLLAMTMNSVHQKTLKITPLNKINQDFFLRVMKAAFSIIPALIQLQNS